VRDNCTACHWQVELLEWSDDEHDEVDARIAPETRKFVWNKRDFQSQKAAVVLVEKLTVDIHHDPS